MAELHFMPLYVDDYEAATPHLTLEEDGAYNRLLRLCWRQPDCTIPNDPNWISRMLRVDKQTFDKIVAPLLAEFFSEQRGRLFQKRQREEFLKGKHIFEKRREAGRKGGKAKSQKTKDNQDSNANEVPEANPKQPLKQNGDTTLASTTTTTTTSTIDSPLPPKGGGGDEFEILDKALRSIPGVSNHPINADPVIAPIWQLVQQGYDFKTQIAPSVKAVLAKAKPNSVKRWSYFVEAIVRDATPSSALPAPDDAFKEPNWSFALKIAREKKTWARKWGPMPGQPGCLVPSELLLPDDGIGWTIYVERDAA